MRKRAAVDPAVLLKFLNTDSLTTNISTKSPWFKEHQGHTGGTELAGFRMRTGGAAVSEWKCWQTPLIIC